MNIEVSAIEGLCQTHELKCEREYFDAVVLRKKTFEVRKNDRDFKVGDHLCLKCGPNSVVLEIVYILPGGRFGIAEDYVVLGVAITVVIFTDHGEQAMDELVAIGQEIDRDCIDKVAVEVR